MKYSLQDISRVKTAFIIDTLDYLYKGRRCTGIQSMIGGILQIKPLINITDGKITVCQKLRGRKKAMTALLDSYSSNKDFIDRSRVFVTHSYGSEDAIFIKNEIIKITGIDNVIITDAGCVISSHCGKNTVGIICMLE